VIPPKRGKSTVNTRFAAAMAQSGRDLADDADMRLPSQHTIWDLLNDAGLSNVLVGQAQLEESAQRSNS